MSPVDLAEARDERRFGGKAVSLGAALRAGLAVPGGLALGTELVDAIAAEQADASRVLGALEHPRLAAVPPSNSGGFERIGALGPSGLASDRFAVRSSAVGEDSKDASFAGQHLTRLNVMGGESILEAVRAVWASGRDPGALAYRRRLGIEGAPQVAVVVQRMVLPDCAGVLFTRDPVTGADERLIEGAWGLGEAVVSGLVTPDCWRMRRGGEVVDQALGDKDLEIVWGPEGGTLEREVEPARARTPCLDAGRLAALEELAARCERYFDGPSDIEWAFEGDALYLLQRRAVTR